MTESPQNLLNNDAYSSYAPMYSGRAPEGIGGLLTLLFGNQMWPLAAPGSKQSQFDAIWQRQHSMEMFQLGRNTVSNIFPFQNMGGMNKGVVGSIASSLLANPDGLFARLMNPVLGGNPIQAQMASLASLQGVNVAGLGTLAGSNVNQLESADNTFRQFFYNDKVRPVNQTLGKKYTSAARNALSSETRKMLGLSDEDVQGLFSKNYEVNTNSSAFKRLNSAESAIADVEKGATDKTNKEDLIKMIEDKYGKDNQQLAKTMEKAIKESFKEGSTTWVTEFAKAVNKNSITEAAGQTRMISDIEFMQKAVKGVNYKNTLGFSYEDLTGARNELLSNRLLGGVTLNQASALAGGSNNAQLTGVLDSLRGLFGNDLSGKEYGQKLNELVGYSNVNLANPADASRFETMARTFQSTSRVLNINKDTMMGLVQGASDLASNNIATSRLGGMEIMPMVSEEALRAAAVSTGMSDRDVRWEGGTAGMLGHQVQGAIESAQQPISKYLAAAHTYFTGDKATQARIEQYSQNGDLTQIGYSNFLRTLPANTNELMGYVANNAIASQVGFSDYSEFQKAGGRAKVADAFHSLYELYGGAGGQGAQMVAKAKGYLANGDVTGLMTDRSINAGGAMSTKLRHLQEKGYLNDWMLANNPTMRANYAIAQQGIKDQTTLDTSISREMGIMNAPTMQRVIQTAINGDMDENGLSAMLKPLGIGPENAIYSGLLGASQGTSRMKGAKTVEELLLASGDYTSDSQSYKSLVEVSKHGIDSDNIDAVVKGTAKRPAGMTDESYRDLQFWATNVQTDPLLKGYKGKYDLAGLSEHLRKGKIDAKVDEIYKGPEDKFKNLLGTDIEAMVKGGGEATQYLGKGLSKLSKEKDADMFDLLQTYQTEQGYEKTDENGNVMAGGSAVLLIQWLTRRNRI